MSTVSDLKTAILRVKVEAQSPVKGGLTASNLLKGFNVKKARNPILYDKNGKLRDPARFVKNLPNYLPNVNLETDLTIRQFKFKGDKGDVMRNCVEAKIGDKEYKTFFGPPVMGVEVALGPQGNYDPSGTRYKQCAATLDKAQYAMIGVPAPFDPAVDDGKGVSIHWRAYEAADQRLKAYAVHTILKPDSPVASEVRDNARDAETKEELIEAKLLNLSTALIRQSMDKEATKKHPENAGRPKPKVIVHKPGEVYIGLSQDIYYKEAVAADGRSLSKNKNKVKSVVIGESTLNQRPPPVKKMVGGLRQNGTPYYYPEYCSPEDLAEIRNGDVFIPEFMLSLSTDATSSTHPTKPFSYIIRVVSWIWLGPGALSGARELSLTCDMDADELEDLKELAKEETKGDLVESLDEADVAALDAMEKKQQQPKKPPIPDVELTEEERKALEPAKKRTAPPLDEAPRKKAKPASPEEEKEEETEDVDMSGEEAMDMEA